MKILITIWKKETTKMSQILLNVVSVKPKNLNNSRYSCVLCFDLIMCSKCESTHHHPTIKFKADGDLNSKHDVYNLLNKFKDDFPKKELGLFNEIRNSFSGSLNFSAMLHVDSFKFDEIRARPNKKFNIPILITNTCKNQIPSNTVVMVRNMYDLKINTQTLNRDLDLKGSLEFDLFCESPNHTGVYNLEIFLFHKVIEVKTDILRVKVVINDDMEEEQLNLYLVKHPKLLNIPKNQKEIIRNIKNDKLSEKDLNLIYNIMDKHNWDINVAIDELLMDY